MDALYLYSFPLMGRSKHLVRERRQMGLTELQIGTALGVNLSADPNYRAFLSRSAKPGELNYTLPLSAGNKLTIDKVE